MKQLQVTMPDGSVWAVPAEVVAEPRAKYYAENDVKLGANFDEVYADEFNNVNEDDLIDWARNNVDWDEVKANAKLITPADSQVDYADGWTNGPMRVVDV